jgi:hypothetical protein
MHKIFNTEPMMERHYLRDCHKYKDDIKIYLNKKRGDILCNEFNYLRIATDGERSCEHGNEPSGSTEDASLSTSWQLHKDGSAPWSVPSVTYTATKSASCSSLVAIFLFLLFNHVQYRGASCTVVGWDTMLQAGRSRFRYSMSSLNFSIVLILPTALWP